MKEALAVHWLLIKFYRQRRWITYELPGSAGYFGTALGNSEWYVLIHLDERGIMTASDLSIALQLDKSTISRLVSSLADRKWIAVTSSSIDGRQKNLSITALGRHQLSVRNNFALDTMNRALVLLSRTEQACFARILQQCADGISAEPMRLTKNVHPLTVPIRRLSKSLALFGESFLGSKFSFLESEIVQVIKEFGKPAHQISIIQALPNEPGTVRAALKRLVERGYVERLDTHLGEKPLFSLTSLGEISFKELEQRASKFYGDAIRQLSADEMTTLLSFLHRVSAPVGSKFILKNDQDLLITPIQTEGDANRARAYYITKMVEVGRAFEIPSRVLDSWKGNGFMLLERGDILGVAEIHPDAPTQFNLFFTDVDKKVANRFKKQAVSFYGEI